MLSESDFSNLKTKGQRRINKNATIVGIWRKNKIRKMIMHHQNYRNHFVADKTFE